MDVLSFSFQSEALIKVQAEIKSLSSVSAPVLIMGERGTGKTTWADALTRVDGIAAVVDANDAPKSLKTWREISLNWDKQPVILENIDKWSDVSQSSFAAFYREQKRNFKRVVATASPKLLGKVKEEQFRSDVYFMLAVRKIDLPQLLDCAHDFNSISAFWIEVSSLMVGKSQVQITPEAVQKLRSHSWEGNFTELINVIERSLTYEGNLIQSQFISFDKWTESESELQAGLTLAEVEKKLIMQTLNLTAQNRSQAARMLGISIRTLRNKLNEYRQEVSSELI